MLHVAVVAADTSVTSDLGVSKLTDCLPSSSMSTKFSDSHNCWETCSGMGNRICGDSKSLLVGPTQYGVTTPTQVWPALLSPQLVLAF